MNQKPSPLPLKAALVGAFSGVLVFCALSAVRAQQALTVSDVRGNQKTYVGTTVAVTGIATDIKTFNKTVKGRPVPWINLNLHEWDAKKASSGPHYIWVSLPASGYQDTPVSGQKMTITGPLQWAYEVGIIQE